jgi:hypothetical protein
MIDHLRFHTLLLLGLLWLCMTVYWLWRRRQAATVPAHRQPVKRSTRRSQNPKPFPGVCPENLKLFISLTFFEFLFMLEQWTPPSSDMSL